MQSNRKHNNHSINQTSKMLQWDNSFKETQSWINQASQWMSRNILSKNYIISWTQHTTQRVTKSTKSLLINKRLETKNNLWNRTSNWWEADNARTIINKKLDIWTHKTLSSNLNQKRKWEFAKAILTTIF